MSDKLTSLLHDTANRVPIALHPAANLRGQAERHQKVRRAGAVAASLAAVLIVSLLAVSPSTENRKAQLPATTPTGSPTSTPAVAGLAGFQFPEEISWREQSGDALMLERTMAPDAQWQPRRCAKVLPTPRPDEVLSIVFSGPEEGQTRHLSLYPDPTKARAAVAALRVAAEECSGKGAAEDDVTYSLDWRTIDVTPGDGGFLALSTVTTDPADADGPSGEYNLVVSRGRAVYVATYVVAHHKPSTADKRADELVRAATKTVPLIDRLLEQTAVPAPRTSTSGSARPSAALTIPSSFGFAEEEMNSQWTEANDENDIKVSNARAAAWVLDPCWPKATPHATDAKRTAMRTLTRSGPEFADTLQLALYPDAATAAAALQELDKALRECSDVFTDTDRSTRHIWTREPLDVGDAGFVAIGRYEVGDAGPTTGSEHAAGYQVGNAVFLRLSSGEAFRPPGEPDPAKDAVVESAEANVDRICRLVSCAGQ